MFKTVSRVTLSGGEPTLCPDLLEILGFFRRKGIVTTLSSNSLRLNETLLRKLSEMGLNTLNLSIYEQDDRTSNLAALERVFGLAARGCFDIDRIWLFYHSTSIQGYKAAYDFAQKTHCRHLFFQRLVHMKADHATSRDAAPEQDNLQQEYVELCTRIAVERKLNLYYFRTAAVPGTERSLSCPQINMNYIVIWPNGDLSPCCVITPEGKYGSIEDPIDWIRFKQDFVEGHIPKICQACSMLGTYHQ